ncbi:hypothetical protein TWF730_008544 [Orbilia blumenaviensis]|uniref:F-box domain-containing protein n=1 Tax=Orbilia blumenaviensis TaxID=1796055 RepID=A0AAV9V3U5_9PEZI
MASLITLSRISELFNEVSRYLEQGDLYSLLLTCRALHLKTYNRLWETIQLETGTWSYKRASTKRSAAQLYRLTSSLFPATTSGFNGAASSPLSCPMVDPYPSLLPVPRRKSTCHRLANIINTLGPQNTGLSLTRKLVFESKSSFSGNALVQSGLTGHIQTLLMNGTLNLSCVELDFDLFVSDEADKEAISSFLTHLREYSKSKFPGEFSIILVSTLSVIMPQLIDVEKVTSLQLSMGWTHTMGIIPTTDRYFMSEEEYNNEVFGGPFVERRSSHPGYNPLYSKALIKRLTSLLLRTPNLTALTLRAPGLCSEFEDHLQMDPNLTEPLQDLQAAIYSLSKLRELIFDGEFCHPSCFIAPPESVRAVSYAGQLSHIWFQSFKGCQFTNVKTLSIHTRSNSIPYYNRARCYEGDFRIQPLGDVAISGLTKFDFLDDTAAAPLDFTPCILRRNPNLDRASRQRAAEMLSLRLQLTAQARLERACNNSLDYLQEAEKHNPYLRSSLPADYSSNSEKGVIELGNQCLKMLPNAIDKIERWDDAQSSAREHTVLCEKKINSLLARFKTMLTLEYAQELLDRGDTTERPEDVANTSKKCLQRMLDNFDDHAWWEAARTQAYNATGICRRRVTNHISSFTAKESTDYILGLVDSGELDNIDVELASEKFIQDCAQKLSFTEFTETQSLSESETQALLGFPPAYPFQPAIIPPGGILADPHLQSTNFFSSHW